MSRPNPKRKDFSLWAIFRIPIVLFVLSLIGLVGALLGDGAWDWLFSALLASTVAATAWALVRSRS
jgi:xanthosine utilization system XapX-like protein